MQSLLREIVGIDQASATTVALVTSETSGSDLVGRTLEPLGVMPRSKSASCDFGVVVAQMGPKLHANPSKRHPLRDVKSVTLCLMRAPFFVT